MKPPILIRPFTPEERDRVEAGLRSSNLFCVRRCQILVAAASGQHSFEIEKSVGFSDQAVRNVIKAFNLNGLKVLENGRHGPHHTRAVFSPDQIERLKELIGKKPEEFGREAWSLKTISEVCYEQGIASRLVGIETMRATLERSGAHWGWARGWVVGKAKRS